MKTFKSIRSLAPGACAERPNCSRRWVSLGTVLVLLVLPSHAWSQSTTPQLVSAAAACGINRIRISFDSQMDTSGARDVSHYAVSGLDVTAVDFFGPNTSWDLVVSPAPSAGVAYTVTVNGLTSQGGVPLPVDSQATFVCDPEVPQLVSVAADCAGSRIRLWFSKEMDPILAHDVTHYSINGLTVTSVDLFGPNTSWDLVVSPALSAGTSYTVTINGLTTLLGAPLPPDTQTTFQCDPNPPQLLSVRADCGANRIRLSFDKDLDLLVASDLSHYSIDNGLTVTGVELTGPNNSWDLIVSPTPSAGVLYNLTLSGLTSLLGTALPVMQPNFLCDPTVPQLMSVSARCGEDRIRLEFNREMDSFVAADLSHYAINDLTVTAVRFFGPNTSWDLIVSPPPSGSVAYTLVLNGLTTLLGTPLAPGTQGTFECRLLRTPDSLGTTPPNFVIEAEDYDFGGGQSLPIASQMPYTGGAYDGLAAILNIDYSNHDLNDGDIYRPDTDPVNVDMIDNIAGRWGTRRPGYDVTTNYRIGWVGDGDWQNYTRIVPAGTYGVWAALSFDGLVEHELRAALSKVTAGVGTPNQTLEELGMFDAPGSGGWGANDLVPMTDGSGAPATFIHPGGPLTLRFSMSVGDFDWFVLTSVGDTIAPTISRVAPNPATLWAPDHRMVPTAITVAATDDRDPNPVSRIISVSSNEPADGLGDGDTSPDWEITGPLSVKLRAERSARGTGRVYTITVQCTDSSGNSAIATTTVTVPLDQKKK